MTPAELAPPVAEIAAKAANLALDLKSKVEGEFKDDGSIVTDADRQVEALIRSELSGLVGDAPVWGEELGHAIGDHNGLWLVDPIDGTTNYAAGSPLWGVSIALLKHGLIQVGAIVLPELGESYISARGSGVYLNGSRLEPIPSGEIMRSDMIGFCEGVAKLGLETPGRQRCLGSFVVEVAWVASQKMRGMIGVRERLYDVAAGLLMIEELGGDVRFASGEPLTLADLLQGDRIAKPWILFPSDSGYFA